MVKVAGIWELGWSAPIKEYDLWAFPLRDFRVDEWIMTPVSGIKKDVVEMENIQSVISSNLNLIPVFVDEKGKVELQDFIHPMDALYILGNAGQSVIGNYKDALSVRIQTPEDKGLLWPHQAICIVLRDRWLSL